MNSLSTPWEAAAWRGWVSKTIEALAATVALLLICLPLFSQGGQGSIQGGVFDQTGGAIAGATVSVTDVARGIARTLVADDAGQYVAASLNPGTYTVRAEAKGFQIVEHSGVLVEVGQIVRMDMVRAARRANSDRYRHRRSPGDQHHRCYLGRNREQSVHQRTAPERPQLRALAGPASGKRYCARRRHGKLEYQWPAHFQ